MIRADLDREKLLKELEILRQRVAELEDLQTGAPVQGKAMLQIEAAEKYSAILESSDDGLLVLDRKDKVIDVNSKLEAIIGYQRKDLIGKKIISLTRLLTNRGLSVFWKNPLKRTVGAITAPREIDIFKKDGELVTVQINYHPLKIEGKVVGRLVILKDVTALKRAERESGDSQEVARSLLSHVGVGIFRTTPGATGRFLEVNPAMEEITGYSREELLQMNVADLYVHPEERAEHVMEVLSGKTTKPREIRFKKKDGTEIVVRDKKVAVRGNDGKTLYFEGFLEDITERKRVEEALKESETKYRNVVELAKDGICIIQNKLIKYCNLQLAEMRGGTVEEINETPFSNYLHPDAFAMTVDRYNRRMAGEQIPSRYETALRRKDGRKLNVELNVGIINYLGRAAEIAIVHDITERKQAEGALRESEEKYRLIVEHTNDLIFTENSAGELTYVSPSIQHVLGYNQADMIGRSLRSLIYPDDISAVAEAVQENIKNGYQKPGGVEFRVSHASGEWRWYSGRGTALQDANGKFVNFLGISNDITERKQTEEALQRSEENFRNSNENSPLGIRILNDRWRDTVHQPSTPGYLRLQKHRRVQSYAAQRPLYPGKLCRIPKEGRETPARRDNTGSL